LDSARRESIPAMEEKEPGDGEENLDFRRRFLDQEGQQSSHIGKTGAQNPFLGGCRDLPTASKIKGFLCFCRPRSDNCLIIQAETPSQQTLRNQGGIGESKEMHGYPVYRVNPVTNVTERVGSILELRRSRRSMNRLGLAKLAQKVFARGSGDIIIVGYDSSMERRQISREYEYELSAG
jgi:hypothetical protein